jgi:hypothetical protein
LENYSLKRFIYPDFFSLYIVQKMGGGLMQLVAYGAQDAFLTGNPEITFFKVVYRRHTNFAMESIIQDFNGSKSGVAPRLTATISRNGDLITNCWLEGCGKTNSGESGAKMIETVDLEIGGQRIDRHYGEWMQIWTELSCPPGKAPGKTTMDDKGIVPLEFFFCRNPGLALPLIALQYHEVKLTFQMKTAVEKNYEDMALYVDYIYLDTDERRRFAQVQHNMLIDQLQMQEGGSDTNTRLNFNHPCKELVWTTSGETVFNKTTLKLNGHDRFSERGNDYFQFVQPYQHHTNCKTEAMTVGEDSINVYSFALKPEEHQPSGTCNFSRIDNAALKTTDSGKVKKVYAVNYNVLRIMSGMGKQFKFNRNINMTAHNSKLPSWIHRSPMVEQQCNSMVACAC